MEFKDTLDTTIEGIRNSATKIEKICKEYKGEKNGYL
jgi:hypothetical protein